MYVSGSSYLTQVLAWLEEEKIALTIAASHHAPDGMRYGHHTSRCANFRGCCLDDMTAMRWSKDSMRTGVLERMYVPGITTLRPFAANQCVTCANQMNATNRGASAMPL